MRLLLIVSLLLCAGLGASAEETPLPQPVALKSYAVVEDDVVRLGDLFDGLGPLAEKAIARAPAPGRQVELSSRWLAALARSHGIAWRPKSGFDRILLERASTTIGAGRIEELLRESLVERGVTGDINLLLDNPAIQLVVPGDVDTSPSLAGLFYDPETGRFTARVAAPAAGTGQSQVTVTGRAVALTKLPVLQRQVGPDGVIGRDDIGWITMRADRISPNIVLDATGLVGKSPRRSIPVDQPVRAGDLREPVTVKKNSLVTIRLQTNRMILTAQGRALEDGAEGGVIRVMNTKSNSIVNAVVANASTVEVHPSADLAAR